MKCRVMTRIMQFCMVLVVVVSAFFYAPIEVDASGIELPSPSEEPEIDLSNIPMTLEESGDEYIYGEWKYVDIPLDSYVYFVQEDWYRSSSSAPYRLQGVAWDSASITSSLIEGKRYQFVLDKVSWGNFYYSTPWTYGTYLQNGSSGTKYEYLLNKQSVDLSKPFIYNGEDYVFKASWNQWIDFTPTLENGVYYCGIGSVRFGYKGTVKLRYREVYTFEELYGADNTVYPLLVDSGSITGLEMICDINTNMPSTAFETAYLGSFDVSINPSHTYKVVFDSSKYSHGTYDVSIGGEDINYRIGDVELDWYFGNSYCYIPGDEMSNNLFLEYTVYSSHYYDVDEVYPNDEFQPWGGQVYPSWEYINFYLYDMGPTGSLQNQIANQTDELTNGFDSSGGQSVNDNFKASVNDYHTAEDSLFTSAKDGLGAFEFVDFTSITGMVTSLSFVTSIMTSIYLAMGGDTGASGIILAVLFSVMLVSMAIGLYRYYVSNGKSGGSNKGGD